MHHARIHDDEALEVAQSRGVTPEQQSTIRDGDDDDDDDDDNDDDDGDDSSNDVREGEGDTTIKQTTTVLLSYYDTIELV